MKHETQGDLGNVLSDEELANAEGVVVPEGVTVLTRDEIRRAVRSQAAQIALSETFDTDDAER